jgi:SAM-dependent methyltransferase
VPWASREWIVFAPNRAGPAFGPEFERRRQAAWLAALAGLLPGGPVDVFHAGCGNTRLAFTLADLGHRVIGVDPDEELVRAVQQHVDARGAGPRLHVGEPVRPSLRHGRFDVVASYGLLSTLMDPTPALARWRELLRPGGRLLALDVVRCGLEEPVSALRAATWLNDVVGRSGYVAPRVELLPEIDVVERTRDGEGGPTVRYAITATRRA